MTKNEFMPAFNHVLFVRMNAIYGIGYTKGFQIIMPTNEMYQVFHDTLDYVRERYASVDTKNMEDAKDFIKFIIDYAEDYIDLLNVHHHECKDDKVKYKNILDTIIDVSKEIRAISPEEASELRRYYDAKENLYG